MDDVRQSSYLSGPVKGFNALHINSPVENEDYLAAPDMAGDESYDSLDEIHTEGRPERWAPLGAAQTSPLPMYDETRGLSEREQLMAMEEEQEQLNSSLLALTTHFAQVQFRLKQIVSAPTEEREMLLQELENFAFKGIPDVRGCTSQDAQILEEECDNEQETRLEEQRQKQQELIVQLKSQLEDLETYAYQSGSTEEAPTSHVMEKQKVIIDELKNKLDLEVDNVCNFSSEELRQVVDRAVGQIVNPAKVKEKLVGQLKTQISDLERFIDFLQGEATTPGPLGETRCSCPVHGKSKFAFPDTVSSDLTVNPQNVKDNNKKVRDTTLSIMKQALTVLQIFAISQFGCGGKEFQKNLLKRTAKGNHWGDLRATLELATERVLQLVLSHELTDTLDTDYTSDTEDCPVIQCNEELTRAVRKEFATALRDLLQHGLMEVGQNTSIVPFGCFSVRTQREKEPKAKMMHVWDLFLRYYEMKHGKEYVQTPARKLSASFDLNMVGGKAITVKQQLLTAIDKVISTHRPLKRSDDSQLKAFICIALNERKLVAWLRLVLRSSSLVEYYYQPWSYVIKTGFDDSLISLDRLARHNFNLPMDLAVRPFKNIRDAF